MSVPPGPRCPYKGLEPYDEDDLAYFFGRTLDAERIANALMTAPLTVLYGKSGVGKSSVLQAAVPPLLRDPENTLVLVWNAWQSPRFLDDMQGALFAKAGAERSADTLDRALPALVEQLKRPVALIFDQFEEYFHYREGPRDAFEQQLARLVNRGHDDIHILLSVREERLASLDRLRRRIPQVLRSRRELKHLTEEGAQEAVDRPLEKFNQVHGTTISIDEELRDRIIEEVSSREPGGALRIEAAYLQLALTRLWNACGGAKATALDAGTFNKLGGAKDIARQHLDDVLEQLSSEEQTLAATLLDRLVTPPGDKIALSAIALAGYAKTDQEKVVALLQKLTRQESRLLRPVPNLDDHAGQGFELFHDVLGLPARAWLELWEKSRAMTVQARGELEYGSPRTAVLLALRGLPDGASTRPLFMPAQALLSHAVSCDREELALIGHEAGVRAVAFHPSGRLLATGSWDRTARLWNAETGELVEVLDGHGWPVTALAFDPSGRWLAMGSGDGTVRLRDSSGAPDRVLDGHGELVTAVAFDPSGAWLATGSDDGTARLWNVGSGAEERVLEPDGPRVFAVAFHPSGARLAIGSFDGTVSLWEPFSGTQEQVLEGHEGPVTGVAFDPSGRWLASGSYDRTARLWDASSGVQERVLTGHGAGVTAVAFDPSGRCRLATGSFDGTARLWNATGTPVQELKGHEAGVGAVAFGPSGGRLATSSDDGTARLWSVSRGVWEQVFEGGDRPFVAVAFDPSGALLVGASDDSTAWLWNVASGEQDQVVEGHRWPVLALALNPSGTTLVIGSDDGTARLWNTVSDEDEQSLGGHGALVEAVAFDPTGTLLATGCDDGTARLWSLDSGSQEAVFRGHESGVAAVALGPSGALLATGSVDGTAQLWNAETGELAHALDGHEAKVTAVAFDPGGRLLATGSDDGTARLWSTETGELAYAIDGHGPKVTAVAFDPSGRLLAAGSDDGMVRLWNAETGELKQLLEGHGGPVRAVTFDRSGTCLATGSDDLTARLWPVFQDLDELVRFAKREHRRLCFTEKERERYFISADEACLERGPAEDVEADP